MRRARLAALLGAVALGTALLGVTLPVGAASNPVILEGSCFLLDGNGAFVSGPRSGNQVEVVTESDGSLVGSCRAVLAPASDGGPREWNHVNTGLSCTVMAHGRLTQTQDWREEISAEGQALLVCRVSATAQ